MGFILYMWSCFTLGHPGEFNDDVLSIALLEIQSGMLLSWIFPNHIIKAGLGIWIWELVSYRPDFVTFNAWLAVPPLHIQNNKIATQIYEDIMNALLLFNWCTCVCVCVCFVSVVGEVSMEAIGLFSWHLILSFYQVSQLNECCLLSSLSQFHTACEFIWVLAKVYHLLTFEN